MNYDLIIIGGGPAGAAAGVYAARKHIKTALITDSFGGQSIESNEIQNWIGTPKISGIDLAKSFKAHVLAYAENFVDVKEGERVSEVKKNDSGFLVVTNKGTYQTKTVLVATGGSRRRLEVPGAKEYDGRGITYCASCDGPFFADLDVVVIGGGNAGFESAAQLLAYCKSVTLLARSDFKADPGTVEMVLSNPKMKAIPNTVLSEIKGNGSSVTSFTYQTKSGEIVEIQTEGIFVEVGHVPNTAFVEPAGVELNDAKHIKIDPRTQRTSVPGIWAAGDCSDVLYYQNNIAAGDAVRALEDIYLELQKMR